MSIRRSIEQARFSLKSVCEQATSAGEIVSGTRRKTGESAENDRVGRVRLRHSRASFL
jgi:hypothetical protein